MIVVGIDTATRNASVALLHNSEIIARRQFAAAQCDSSLRTDHSETLIPLINAALQDAGVALTQINGVAVSIGPGSFTGVRIGLSTAKGIAYGCAVPVVGVSTLQACAATNEDAELICSLLDARKAEVYMALFARCGSKQQRLTDDFLLPVDKALEELKRHIAKTPCVVLGEGAEVYRSRISNILGEHVQIRPQLTDCVAVAVARLGAEQIAAGVSDDVARLTPVYGRAPDAEARRQEAHNSSN